MWSKEVLKRRVLYITISKHDDGGGGGRRCEIIFKSLFVGASFWSLVRLQILCDAVDDDDDDDDGVTTPFEGCRKFRPNERRWKSSRHTKAINTYLTSLAVKHLRPEGKSSKGLFRLVAICCKFAVVEGCCYLIEKNVACNLLPIARRTIARMSLNGTKYFIEPTYYIQVAWVTWGQYH